MTSRAKVRLGPKGRTGRQEGVTQLRGTKEQGARRQEPGRKEGKEQGHKGEKKFIRPGGRGSRGKGSALLVWLPGAQHKVVLDWINNKGNPDVWRRWGWDSEDRYAPGGLWTVSEVT